MGKQKQKAPRNNPSVKELQGAAEHLQYEYRMFFEMAGQLGRHSGWMHNAVLESFTIHARVLLDFLYKMPGGDDVAATDYFNKPEEWKNVLPPKPPALEAINGRVGKEVAHLTYTRIGISERAKHWDVPAIVAGMETLMNKFYMAAPRENLHPSCKPIMVPLISLSGGITSSSATPTGGRFDPIS